MLFYFVDLNNLGTFLIKVLRNKNKKKFISDKATVGNRDFKIKFREFLVVSLEG